MMLSHGPRPPARVPRRFRTGPGRPRAGSSAFARAPAARTRAAPLLHGLLSCGPHGPLSHGPGRPCSGRAALARAPAGAGMFPLAFLNLIDS